MIQSLHLLRYVDRRSIVHRADSRTKVLMLTALVFAVSFDPTWSTIGIIWGLAVVGFIAARLPLGALPKPPKALLWAMGIALAFGLLAGGDPVVSLGGSDLGIGGLIYQVRFFGVILGLLALALLLGWTTPLGELPAAASWMLKPLAKIGVPIDDVVAGLTLAVRALPLMAEEFATTTALWSLRPKEDKSDIVRAVDLSAVVTMAATRRATELGEAVANRGPIVVPQHRASWSVADAIVGLCVAGAVAAVVLL